MSMVPKGRGRSARETAQGDDLYAQVTRKILGQLEAGRLPWVQPWGSVAGGPSPALPRNALSGRPYSGINILMLWGAVIEGGWPSQSWLTFKQAIAAGGCVRKGERGTMVVYADRFVPADDITSATYGPSGANRPSGSEGAGGQRGSGGPRASGSRGASGGQGVSGGNDAASRKSRAGGQAGRTGTEAHGGRVAAGGARARNGSNSTGSNSTGSGSGGGGSGGRGNGAESDSGAPRAIPFLKRFTLFNVAQCEGLRPGLATDPAPLPERQIVPEGEKLIAASGVPVHIGGDRAYYAPALDHVQVPPQPAFFDQINFYRTCFHELCHATGHPTRLARDLANGFGTKGYAREELVAEMGAAFLCASLGIEPAVRHADYIGGWVELLRDDLSPDPQVRGTGSPRGRAIFRAASAAGKAADWLLERHRAAESELAA